MSLLAWLPRRSGETRRAADPALDDGLGLGGIPLQQLIAGSMNRRQQRGIAHQVGHAERGDTGLSRAQQLARSAQFEVLLGDHEAVGGLAHHVQALPRQLRKRRLVQERAARRLGAAADASAQLVQLGQAEALGVLDHHQAGVGHVDADLDDGGGHQQLQLTRLEGRHDLLLLRRLHASVQQADAQLRQRRTQRLVGGLRGLCVDAHRFAGLGLVDERAHPVHLAALRAGMADALDDFLAPGFRQRDRGHWRAPRRHFVDHRNVQVGVGRHRQRARDRRGGHHQLVRHAKPVQPLVAQRQALVHAEAVLFVHDHQRQFAEGHALLHQRVGADHDLPFAAGDLRQSGGAARAR